MALVPKALGREAAWMVQTKVAWLMHPGSGGGATESGDAGSAGSSGRGDAGSATNGTDGAERGKTDGAIVLRGGVGVRRSRQLRSRTRQWGKEEFATAPPSRVATKVGFQNFAKFREIYRYEFREIWARNLISRNSAKSSHYRFSRNLYVRISRKFLKSW
jgi:hypothetical protein